MFDNDITILRASKNNLRNVDLQIRRDRITTVVGVSGSGKSALIVGSLAAEAQRQLNETYPPHIQNRLPRAPDAQIGAALHLTPTVVVDQRPLSGGARSTVGTHTASCALLRLLFSRVGSPSAGESTAYSFNDPRGMCPECDGLGIRRDIDLTELLDERLSLADGAVRFASFRPGTFRWRRLMTSGLFDTDRSIADFTAHERDTLLYATDLTPVHPLPGWPRSAVFEGLVPRITRSYLRRNSEHESGAVRADIDRVAPRRICPSCHGSRLNAAARASLIEGESISDWAQLDSRALTTRLTPFLDTGFRHVAAPILALLDSMQRLGIGYLSLDRRTDTLSGGESQRVKLITHLGSSLSGMTYVFDEPSRGLHPADIGSLRALLVDINRKGNTVIIIEHDPSFIGIADEVIEMGPGAGRDGGRIVFSGTAEAFTRSGTLSARMLREHPAVRGRARPVGEVLRLRHLNRHNLRDVSVDVPTDVLTAITGVAGAGKSSLVSAIVATVGERVTWMSQRPVPRSARMSVGSFLGVLEPIRERFAAHFGVRPGRFSANSEGACADCRGLGEIVTDMAFMESVTRRCPSCAGTRFSEETRALRWDGLNIADVLGWSLAELVGDERVGETPPGVATAHALGLGYLTLGQPLTALSGGELVRLKLARATADPGNLVILDEPAAGLHPADTARLAAALQELVERGRGIVFLEHNMRLVAEADWVIDIGPGGGTAGGSVVGVGTPADIAQNPRSVTGPFLRPWLAT